MYSSTFESLYPVTKNQLPFKWNDSKSVFLTISASHLLEYSIPRHGDENLIPVLEKSLSLTIILILVNNFISRQKNHNQIFNVRG